MNWTKHGFDDFQKGTMGNGGQNLYVSRRGVLQRIFHYDVNGDGYPDLLFANSQSMGERPPVYVYKNPLNDGSFFTLPSNGVFDAVVADFNNDGYDDLVLAAQHNGTHSDITSCIYYGSPEGWSERYRVEIPVPGAISVAAGDFYGSGALSLAFACQQGLRVFRNDIGSGGILPFKYTDLDISAEAVTGGDIDGDGYADLYVKQRNGSAIILWGGPEGFSADNLTVVVDVDNVAAAVTSSTAGMLSANIVWKPCLLTVDGRMLLFFSDGCAVKMFVCGQGRVIKQYFSLECKNAIAASAGDLDGDGNSDIAIVCCADRNRDETSYVFWNRHGFSSYDSTAFDTRAANHVEIADMENDGQYHLLVAQRGSDTVCNSLSRILSFDKSGAVASSVDIQGCDAVRLLSGHASDTAYRQIVAVNHKNGRLDGSEDVSIFLGGPDGYMPERCIQLPGHSAVSGIMFDSNDNGYVDVLISNCHEDAPHKDDGSYLYMGGPDGLSAERKQIVPTIRDHGAIIGDFRRCGYLDIASGGFLNRSIRIFRGGADGYDWEHPDELVFGPVPEGYAPPVYSAPGKSNVDPQESEVYRQYGEIRWLFAADFNGDGWLDLFVSQITGKQCFILWGGPQGFSTDRMQILYTDGVATANAADLDGDGYLDLILAGHMSVGKTENGKYESYVTIYWGGPNGYEEHRKTQLPAFCANSVCVGDFNGDGVLDIYATAYNDGRNRDLSSYVYYGKPGGLYSLANCQPLFNHSGSGCVSGDFNADGYCDVAVACHKQYGNHVSTSFVFWGGPEGLSEARKTSLPTVGPHGMMTVDAGNIMDRGDREYYLSEPYAIPAGAFPVSAFWEAEIPLRCSVFIQFRSGRDVEDLEKAAWSEWREQGNNLYQTTPGSRYLQYRIALGAVCSCGTPRVTSITVVIGEE